MKVLWVLAHVGVSINGGTPIAGWFVRENRTKMDDDWEYPYFRKPPCSCALRAILFLAEILFCTNLGSSGHFGLEDVEKDVSITKQPMYTFE